MINKIRINNKTRGLKQYNEVLGLLGENKYETLRFTFDEFIDGFATLIVKKHDTQGNLQNYFINLTKEDESYTLEVQNSLLDVAEEITMQLIVENENRLIFKTLPFKMEVLEAMEAEQEIPEQYSTWNELLVQKFLQVDNKLAEVTALEEDLEDKVQSGYFKGDKGDTGDPGQDGVNGTDGQDGADGFSPTVQTQTIETGIQVTITDINGEHTFTVLNGQDGQVDEQTVAQAVQSYLEQNPIQVPTSISELTEDSTHRTVTDIEKTSWSNKSNFSGNYNDLSNKPTIPAEVTENTVSGWGFTKNTGTYSKPVNGIPKTDLETSVQTSLDKADTALQAHQDISGKLDTNKVKNTQSTVAGDVYDVRYINSVLGDISTVLASLVTVGGGN